jgi:protoheme IX farnesyltransferase
MSNFEQKNEQKQIIPPALEVLIRLQTVLPCLALIGLSFAPMFMRTEGLFYTAGAFVFNVAFSYYGIQLIIDKSNVAARRLLLASIIYLPLIFLWMILNRV